MKGVEKIRDGLYVKNSFDGYRVVYPFKNDDGTWNWFNFITGGNYWKLIKVGLILLMLLGLSWSYMRDVGVCIDLTEKIQNNPHEFCNNLTRGNSKSYLQVNLSEFDKLKINEGDDGNS